MRWDSDSPVRRVSDSGSAAAKPAASDAAATRVGDVAEGRARKELDKSRSIAVNRGRVRRDHEQRGGGGQGKTTGSASCSGASSRESASPASVGKAGVRRGGRTRRRGEAERSSAAGAQEAKRSENDGGVGDLRKSGRSRLPVPAAEEEEAVGGGERGEAVQSAETSSAAVWSWGDTLNDRGTAGGSPAPAAVAEPAAVAKPGAVAEPAAVAEPGAVAEPAAMAEPAAAAASAAGRENAEGNGQLTGSDALSRALKSPGGVLSQGGARSDSDSGSMAENRDDVDRDPGFAEASGKPRSGVTAEGSVENESGYGETFPALAAEEVGGEDRGDEGTLRVRDSDAGDTCSRESGPGLEGMEGESRDARSGAPLATAARTLAESDISEAEAEAAAAVAVTPVGDEDQDASGDDGLTATFHAHLTPALCELWEGTEEGTSQRQAVQDLAMVSMSSPRQARLPRRTYATVGVDALTVSEAPQLTPLGPHSRFGDTLESISK
ncbi:unnamed protein product [Laminaria digitata]